MESKNGTRLIEVLRLSTEYCSLVENAAQTERDDFVKRVLTLLPQLYHEFLDIEVMASGEASFGDVDYFGASYLEQDYYESVRRNMERLFGEEDTFLQTFEEDMKYSDTPIAASVSESLADIFQPLYDFVSVCRDTEGERIAEAFAECREKFETYWSRTLCVVMCALNNIRFFN